MATLIPCLILGERVMKTKHSQGNKGWGRPKWKGLGDSVGVPFLFFFIFFYIYIFFLQKTDECIILE